MQQLLLVLSPHLIKLKATFPIQAGRDTREKSRSWVWRQKSASNKASGVVDTPHTSGRRRMKRRWKCWVIVLRTSHDTAYRTNWRRANLYKSVRRLKEFVVTIIELFSVLACFIACSIYTSFLVLFESWRRSWSHMQTNQIKLKRLYEIENCQNNKWLYILRMTPLVHFLSSGIVPPLCSTRTTKVPP
jgi:hypothetical protein